MSRASEPQFARSDFPPSRGWDRRVALANRQPSSAYKPSRHEINLGEVIAIFKAYEACVAYLQREPGGRGEGTP